MQKRTIQLAQILFFIGASMAVAAAHAVPGPKFSAGIWGTYQYLPGGSDTEKTGQFTDEALILYVDSEEDDRSDWLYSAELRIGPGSFTDPENNATGRHYGWHKAWIGWQFDEHNLLSLGKSQVPFGWKTSNFWPGDMLQAGFGDQMDVGLKLSGEWDSLNYALAYYAADDWGGSSTDTMDDNGHWGSSNTFRKVDTWVGNLRWQADAQQSLGLSLQSGKLRDLTGITNKSDSGSHKAAVIYYEADVGDMFFKASYIKQSRELPTAYWQSALLQQDIENDRYAVEIGYSRGDWTVYLDATAAKPRTKGSTADRVKAFAPGVRYDYGPGSIYLEYLRQDGYVDRNGQVGEGDFDALYLTVDFYL